MKIRLGSVATLNILIVVICCEAGQMLVDEVRSFSSPYLDT
jgi:hypothetical protein